MKATTIKGLTHLAMTMLAGYEAAKATTKAGKLIQGAAMGYHLHATLYHFLWEEEEERNG